MPSPSGEGGPAGRREPPPLTAPSSPYYYRYAYPMDAIVTVGVHFQLTKRSGKTSQALRQEAKRIVYGTH